jgi:hypothetical protein
VLPVLSLESISAFLRFFSAGSIAMAPNGSMSTFFLFLGPAYRIAYLILEVIFSMQAGAKCWRWTINNAQNPKKNSLMRTVNGIPQTPREVDAINVP